MTGCLLAALLLGGLWLLLRRAGGVVIVEQNVNETLKFADYAYIVSEGEIALHGTPQELLKDDEIRRIYLGHS